MLVNSVSNTATTLKPTLKPIVELTLKLTTLKLVTTLKPTLKILTLAAYIISFISFLSIRLQKSFYGVL